jgi:hypothetical protein
MKLVTLICGLNEEEFHKKKFVARRQAAIGGSRVRMFL